MSEIFIPARLKGFPLLTAGKLYDCHLFIWESFWIFMYQVTA